MSQRPCIVIVGRANVGKSSLFNRILGRRAAVVHDRPGVTRDRHFREWEFEGRTYDLVDTGGFIDESIDPLAEQVRNQIDIAVAAADVVLFLVDARTGVTYDDLQIARHVLRREKPLLLLANKSERPQDREERESLRQLGMGEALPVSATTGYGMEGFIERLRRILPKGQGRGPRDEMIRMAILGRPNSGKSTLVNKLLGEDRVIVSPIPGTTRDSVDAEFVWEGHKFQVTDTAGLRKKAKVKDDVEYYSNMRALESIRRSEVVVLLADSLLDMKDEGLSEQDLRIMRQVEESGKGLVIGLSKWDALEKDHRTFDEIVKEMRARVSSIAETPIVAFSGKSGQRVPKLLEEVMRVREGCRRVLGRENVIEYFLKATEHQKPPHSHGKPVRITRCCQVTCDPPMLAFETDSPDDVAESYRRYLRQRAIDHFNLAGVPLRIAFRTKLELRTDEDLARFGDLPEGHELLKVPTESATPENPSEDP